MNPPAGDFANLLQVLVATPSGIQKLVTGLSHHDFIQRTPVEAFSALENICHLRDLEIKAYGPRIDRILKETEPALADFDGARLAAQSDYNSEDPFVALHAFSLARTRNVSKLESLSEEQLQRHGLLEGVGRITLPRLAELMREHDEGHLEDLRVLRKGLELWHQTQQLT